jgi:hypothetical protein
MAALCAAWSLFAAMALPLSPDSAAGAVRIIIGPTPIPGGQANAAGDLTLLNEKLAVAISVNSSPPWAIPKGALIDAAPVVHGSIQHDRVAFADFLPNGWSAWPSAHQRVEIVTDTPALAVVRATRDWNAVQIVTTYSLRTGDDAVHILVTMTNGGSTPVTGALSGFVLWVQGGYFFGVPGLPHQFSGAAAGAMADRIVAYDKDWLVALHEPVFDGFDFGQKDLFLRHTLAPGQSRTFEGWLQILGQGDMGLVFKYEIHRRKLSSGTVEGAVRAARGPPLKAPVVVVEKGGVPYAWTLGQAGHYALELPVGRYELYATSDGYSESPHTTIPCARMKGCDGILRDFCRRVDCACQSQIEAPAPPSMLALRSSQVRNRWSSISASTFFYRP